MTKKVLIAPRINQHDILPTLVVDTRLVNFLLKMGVLPILLPLSQDCELNSTFTKIIFDLIPEVSGVIIQGGKEDIDSSFYSNDEPKNNFIRDIFELEIIQQSQKQNKSILGICRGMQMINVAFGGTLIPDLGTKNKTHLSTYDYNTDYNEFSLDNVNPGLAHKIIFSKQSQLYPIFGESIMVNSVHHQAVDKLGKDLKIDAMASDGIIEIISHESKNILGVQFHPEFDLENHNFKTIINYWFSGVWSRGRQ